MVKIKLYIIYIEGVVGIQATGQALTKHGRKFGINVFKTRTYLHCCFTVSVCVLYVHIDIYSVVYSKL